MPIPRFVKPGGTLTLIIVGLGVAVVLAAAVMMYVETQKTPPATSTAPEPQPVEPEPVPSAPLKLPVADAAGDPHPNSNPDALIHIPAAWNDNVTLTQETLKQQFEIIRNQMQAPGQDMPAVTLAMEPDVKCPVLAKALLAGRDHRVWAFNFACIKAPDAREVRYLKFTLPGSGVGPIWNDQPTVSRIKIRSLKSGDVAWEIDGFLLDSWQNVESLLAMLSKRESAANTIFVLDPDPVVTVQQFIDVQNLLVKQGWKHISMARPRDESLSP